MAEDTNLIFASRLIIRDTKQKNEKLSNWGRGLGQNDKMGENVRVIFTADLGPPPLIYFWLGGAPWSGRLQPGWPKNKG